MAAVIRPPISLHEDLRWSMHAHESFRLLVPQHVVGDDCVELIASQPFVRYDRTSFGDLLTVARQLLQGVSEGADLIAARRRQGQRAVRLVAST